jgi:hypothetical protein
MINFDEYDHIQELGEIVLTSELQDQERKNRTDCIFGQVQDCGQNHAINILGDDCSIGIECDDDQTMDCNMWYHYDNYHYDDDNDNKNDNGDYDTYMDLSEDVSILSECDVFEIII